MFKQLVKRKKNTQNTLLVNHNPSENVIWKPQLCSVHTDILSAHTDISMIELQYTQLISNRFSIQTVLHLKHWIGRKLMYLLDRWSLLAG